MTNQTMTRSEWVSSQLLTWQNVVSSIAIFSIQDVTPMSSLPVLYPVPPGPYFLPGAISY
jgi:hypothetical protein